MSAGRAKPNLVLVGFMGSGKTEVGRRLAEATGRRFLDTDDIVRDAAGPIGDIFRAEGEEGFRRREREAVRHAAAARDAVVATGGGAVLDAENVALLRSCGVVVYLEVGADELARRLGDAAERPLLAGCAPEGRSTHADIRSRIAELLGQREDAYTSAADHVIAADGLSVAETVSAVLARIGHGAVRVPLDPPYEVHVSRGLLQDAGSLLPFTGTAERVLVVSHPRVLRLWGERLERGLAGHGVQVSTATFPEGERHKTLRTAERLWRRLAAEGFHRNDAVVALGGGVAGDVAGFVAAGYARGIAYAQAPTTLLGMVDAAIGGKTGVNLPEGKNLVGSFHQPAAVLCDLDTLTTLPRRELRGGLAEVVKYALIRDPRIGDELTRAPAELLAGGAALEPLIRRSAEIKAEVVAADEREADLRAILNYGHTLGHALEACAAAGGLPAGRRRLHHGEAIAVGMLFAAWVAVIADVADPGLIGSHRRLLDAVGLPTAMPGLRWEDVAPFMAVDKKYAGSLRLVLLERPGAPVIRGDIPEQTLREAFRHVTDG